MVRVRQLKFCGLSTTLSEICDATLSNLTKDRSPPDDPCAHGTVQITDSMPEKQAATEA
jgi:hypothetical protein